MSVFAQRYRSSPSGFPQDLSCRSKDSSNISKNFQRLVDLDDSETCLPSITTFSHNQPGCTDSCVITSGKSSRRGSLQKKSKLHKLLDHKWPSAHSGFPKERVKRSSKHNIDGLPIVCKECDRTFSTKENLTRHMHVHLGSKPYICKYCGRSYARTSERSRCLRKHEFQKSNPSEHIEPGIVKQLISKGLSAFDIENLVDRSRVRPYVCPICEDHRAYTDPSCLRKHMRSFHPDYRHNLMSGKKSMSGQTKQDLESRSNAKPLFTTTVTTTPTTDEPISLVLPPSIDLASLPISNTMDDLSLGQSVIHEADLPGKPVSTIDLDQLYTNPIKQPSDLNINRSWSDGSSSSSSSSYIPVITVNLIPDQTVILDTPLESSDCTAEFDNTNVPIDLCNTALCLQVFVDKPNLSNSSNTNCNLELPDSSQIVLTDSGYYSAPVCQPADCEQDGALDLTDAQFFAISKAQEAMDLSGDSSTALDLIAVNPIDLSLSQPYLETSTTGDRPDANLFGFSGHLPTNWEPEPGFSFTDLLASSDNEYLSDMVEIPSWSDLKLPNSESKLQDIVVDLNENAVPPPLDLRLGPTTFYSYSNC